MQPPGSYYYSFGDTLAASGDTLLVGDQYADGTSGTATIHSAGLVHQFSLATGNLIRTISNPVPSADDNFGQIIAMSGNSFVVGTYTNGSGNIHAFNLTTGSLINTFTNPANSNSSTRQLYSAAIGHEQLLIGSANFSLGSGNEETGAVFVIDAGTKVWKTTLYNETPAAGDQLGSVVAASETRIVVGAPYNDAVSAGTGRAMIYDAKTGAQLFTLDPTISSGVSSVATYGNIVAVGAPGYRSESGDKVGGGVLIYDATTGSLLRTISNPSGTYDAFGRSIALFGDKLVVGAPASDAGAQNAGRIYEYDVNSGTLLATINNPSPSAEESFGQVLTVSESVIVAGVPDDNTSGSGSGEAYVFSVSSGLLIRTLSNPTPDTYDHYGISVAASGDFVAVGATGDSTQGIRSGQVYLYKIGSSDLIRTFSNPSPLQYQNFGYSISMSGNVLIIGNRSFDLPHTSTGQAYIYDVRNGALIAALKNPTSAVGDYFGHAVAISGNTLVVGAPYDDTQNTDQGAAYLYELSSTPLDLEVSSETVPANSEQDLIVGTLTTYSQALNPVQYSYQIVAGAGDTDNARFLVMGNQLILKPSTGNIEKTIYNVRVRSSDEFGHALDKPFTIKVGNHLNGTDAADAFVLTYSSTSTVGTVTVTASTSNGPIVNLGTFPMNSPLTINGLGGTDSIRVVGTAGADTFAVNSSSGLKVNGASLNFTSVEARTLTGAAGGDLYKFDADSLLGAWTLDEAGGGTDTVDLSPTSTVGLVLNLATAGTQVVHATNLSLTLNSAATFENAIGGAGADTLIGNSLNNTLVGGAGDDKLLGAAGNDLLIGGANNDSYTFLAAAAAEVDQVSEGANGGIDTLIFAHLTTGVMVNLGVTSPQTVHTNRTLMLNSSVVFENIIGGSGADTLFGNTLNNTLTGGAGDDKLLGGGGNDVLLGGANNDTYMFVPASTPEADTVTENANEGIDTLNFAYLTTSVVVNLGSTSIQQVHTNRTLKLNSVSTFENAVGGTGSDTLLGNALANRLTGGEGNNILVGLEAGDILEAGSGRDILIGGLGLDILKGGTGDDILIAGRTTNDTSLTNLNTLRTQWISGNTYATRITNLRAGVGNPVVSLKAKINVLNDAGEDDVLYGGADTDWFFRALDDVIADLVGGELIDVL
jgi:Ca2+-binding RTX toxin-like protein